jgi:hypothetical protein
VEAELETFLAAYEGVEDDRGRRAVVRHHYHDIPPCLPCLGIWLTVTCSPVHICLDLYIIPRGGRDRIDGLVLRTAIIDRVCCRGFATRDTTEPS